MSRPALEVLEERCLMAGDGGGVVKWTFGDTQNNLYVLQSYSPQDANLGPIGGLDPAINLVIGQRYTAVIGSFPHHPLELLAGGASPFDDVVLLAQVNRVEPNNETATWEADPGVDWTTDPASKSVSFTMTPALAEAMFDPARGLTPQYRCGNPFHRGFQRGALNLSPGAPTPKAAPHDGSGADLADASTLAADARGAATAAGAIESPGGVDAFRYVAPVTGTLTITQAGGRLGNLALIYDESGKLVELGGSGAAGSTARVQYPVVAGATYYIQAAGYRGSVGAYHLAVSVQPRAAAAPGERLVTLDGAGSAALAGGVGTPGGRVAYQLTATATGDMTVTEAATPGSAIDPLLLVDNASGVLVAADNDGGGGRVSRVTFPVVAGQAYRVQAGALGLSLGAYTLTVATQDFGDRPDQAAVVTLSTQENADVPGRVDDAGEGDYFQFTAPFSGAMAAELDAAPGGAMRPTLAIQDSSGTPAPGVAEAVLAGGAGVRAAFPVVEGKVYVVRAGAIGAGVGGFVLHLAPAAPAGGFAAAVPIALSVAGAAEVSGAIGLPGESFLYRVTPPTSGLMAVEQRAAGGTALDSVLAAYDASGSPLAADDDGGGGRDSLVRFPVVAGRTYYLRAAGSGTSTGQYVLSVGVDAIGHDFVAATPLPLDASGAGRSSGTIGWGGAVDVFRLVAPATGAETIRLDAAAGSTLDGVLRVYDAGRDLIAQDDDSDGYDARVDAPLVAGQAYYVEVAGFGSSLGGYDLLVGDGLGDGPAAAFPIVLDPQGYAAQSGWIDRPGEVTTFRFVAPATGTLTVAEVSAPEDSFLGTLTVLDAAGRTLARQAAQAAGGVYKAGSDIDELSSVVAKVNIPVVAGATYYFQAAGQGTSTGKYLVDVALDDPYGAVADPAPQDLVLSASTHSAGLDGQVTLPGDRRIFRVTAPLTGELVINQTVAPGDFLGAVQVTPPGGAPLLTDTATLGGDDPAEVGKGYSRIALRVTAGSTYFIEVGGVGSSFGAYHLELREFPATPLSLSTHDLSQGVTPAAMVATLLGPANPTVRVVPGSVSYTGSDVASGAFAGGAGILDSREGAAQPFAGGIVLTNGAAANVIGPNDDDAKSQVNGLPGSPLLDKIVRGGSLDASTLTFQFVPTVNVIQLRYVFASEEYNTYVGTPFSDVFGFFVNGVDYARVPGTGTPLAGTGQTVSVNSINDQVNSQYYVDNSFTPAGGFGHLNTQMNGLTRVLTMMAPVQAGQVNTITLTIADTIDPQVDSAVFLQAGSLHAVREAVPVAAGDLAFAQLVQQANAQGAGVAAGRLTEAQAQFAIQQATVDALIKSARLTGDYLVIPIDPVDFTLTGPGGLQAAGAGQRGAANVPNAFFAGDGANQLLVIPNANPGQYQVSLVGVGSGPSLFGASYVTASGQVSSVLLSGDLRGASTSAILDFRDPTGGLVQGSLTAPSPAPSAAPATGTGGATVASAAAAANPQVLSFVGALLASLTLPGPGGVLGGGLGPATALGAVTTPAPQPSTGGRPAGDDAAGGPDSAELARELAALLKALGSGLLGARARLGLILGDGWEARLSGLIGALRPGLEPSEVLLRSILTRLRARTPSGGRTRLDTPAPARPAPQPPDADATPAPPSVSLTLVIAGIGLARLADRRALGLAARGRGRDAARREPAAAGGGRD